MKIIDALRVFDRLKRQKVFKDYAIGGAVAVAYYVEPRATRDIDIFLLADYEENKLTWDILEELGYRHGESIIIEDVPVDIVPSSLHPFYGDAIKKSKRIRMGDIWVKVFTPEYLIATKLLTFRSKDKNDISDLFRYEKIDLEKLEDILSRGLKGEKKILLGKLRKILEEEEQGR